MHTVVEVGGWEHDCCGPAYEREAVVQLSCLMTCAPGEAERWVACSHEIATDERLRTLRGRVVDIVIQHPDGSTEQVERLPSGRALRGLDEHDDGHLEQPWTSEPVTQDSDRYLVTIAT